MKNLFSINRTDNKESAVFDENPYLAARVSADIHYRLEHVFDDALAEPTPPPETEESRAQKRKGRIYWIICGASLVLALILFVLSQQMTGTAASSMTVIYMGLLVVSIVFNYMARRLARKQTKDERAVMEIDYAAMTAKLEEISAEAARELGVPADARSMEILPYHYKEVSGGTTPAGKRNRFDNVAVSAWVESGVLCMASAQELFRVPLCDIRGLREIDEAFEIDYWLKSEAHDSETYKAFNIRKVGFMARKCRGYTAVDVGGDFEFFVPCYDRTVLANLIGK